MRFSLQLKVALSFAAMLFAAPRASTQPIDDTGDRSKGSSVSGARECTPSFHFINPSGRTHQDLSGTWRIIPDPVREGLRSDVGAQYAIFRDESDATNPPHRLKEYDFAAATPIEVPGSWSRIGGNLEWYDGLVWHQREFRMKRSPSRRYFLYFGAANYEANVFLNGEKAGAHKGGFTPFDLEVTHLLKDGANSLVVAVDSAHGEKSVPTARTDWWNYGGITRPPLIVETPETFIADYWIRLDANGRIAADISFDGKDAAGMPASLRIAELGLSIDLVADGAGRASARIEAPHGVERWSPERPKLYEVEITAGGETVRDRIGFRSVSATRKDILLNGESVFLRGVSMHEESVGATPLRYLGEEGARRQLSIIKGELHGNFVRLAHYPHAEETLRVADEIGLMAWSEIPIYWDIDFDDAETLANARAMLCDNIMRDRNRASIIIWSVANETPLGDARNRFLETLIADARRLGPDRLVAFASHQNRQQGGVVTIDDPLAEKVDLLAANYYGGWYGGDLSDLASLRWDRRVEKPMIFSEFGAGALAGLSDPADRRMFSVDYQADYYEATIGMAKAIPFLRGASPWVLKDFRSPRRFHPVYQQYWNRKGLLSPSGEKKPAFFILRDWYRETEGGPEAQAAQ